MVSGGFLIGVWLMCLGVGSLLLQGLAVFERLAQGFGIHVLDLAAKGNALGQTGDADGRKWRKELLFSAMKE